MKKEIIKTDKKRKYCRYCGEILFFVDSDHFDENTGKRKTYQQCINVKCEEGCEFEGHQWGSFWRFENWEKCQRCGYVICDY